MNPDPLRERTVTRSFRLKDTALAVLTDDALRHGVSVNTLLNQVLALYARGDRRGRYLHLVAALGEEQPTQEVPQPLPQPHMHAARVTVQ